MPTSEGNSYNPGRSPFGEGSWQQRVINIYIVPSRRHATLFVGGSCEFVIMVLGIATIAVLHMH